MTWREIPVGAAFDVRNGATPSSDEPGNWDGEIPWVTPADLGKLTQPEIASGSRSITPEGFSSCGTQMVAPGSIILSIRAPVGHIAIATNPMCFNQGCRGLVPRKVIRSDFAYWSLVARRPQLEAAAQGTTFLELSRGKLRAERIPLPDLAAQKGIAGFLDRETARIDQLIEKKQRLSTISVEKRTSLIAYAVTKGIKEAESTKDSGIDWVGDIPTQWQVQRLLNLAVSLQTGPFGSQLHSEDYIDDGYPVINPSHMADGRIRPDPRCSVEESMWVRLARHQLEVGDVVFARRGELGRCALVTTNEAGWLCGTGSMRMRPRKDLVFPAFLNRTLSTKGVAEWLSLQSVGATMENLNTGILGRLPLPVPPLPEQQKINAYLEIETCKIDILLGKQRESVARLKELRSALITAAVTGQIDIETWGRRGGTDKRLEAIEAVNALTPSPSPSRETAQG